ncbi:MAG TPA: hypothetical protein VMG08_17615 [Allosphingosinicella sp.]|nr:hypothetical protein [Allosphingosinicella sp.]
MFLEQPEKFAPADNQFWQAKCRKLLVRPAMEPIACSYWRRFGAFDLDDTVALVLASTLGGRRLVYRRGPATGRSAEGDVTFEPLETAARWLPRITAAMAQAELLPAAPIYAFAQTIMAHPFSDANGRFARLLVHAGLARCAGATLPAVALAPAFYRRAATLGRALTALSDSGDWVPFNDLFLTILEEALADSRALRRRSAR